MADIPNVIDLPLLGKAVEQITPEWLGLGNVDNTADNDKYVAYAQRAGNADKVQNTLTIRLNGGRTEGSNAWTFDGSTGRTINVTPAKVGAVAVSQGTGNAGKLLYVNASGNVEPIDIPTLKTLLGI